MPVRLWTKPTAAKIRAGPWFRHTAGNCFTGFPVAGPAAVGGANRVQRCLSSSRVTLSGKKESLEYSRRESIYVFHRKTLFPSHVGQAGFVETFPCGRVLTRLYGAQIKKGSDHCCASAPFCPFSCNTPGYKIPLTVGSLSAVGAASAPKRTWILCPFQGPHAANRRSLAWPIPIFPIAGGLAAGSSLNRIGIRDI